MSRLVVACLLLACLSVAGVDALSAHRLQSAIALQANVGAEAKGVEGTFTPPPHRMCVMYNYALKHDDDGSPNYEHHTTAVGQLPDGTTYGQDMQGKQRGFAPCVLVNLEGDLVNTKGEIMSKFKLDSRYPTPPCLGKVHSGFFGTKNSAGNKCTPLHGRDLIWRNDNGATWYADPKKIPAQAAAQKSLTQLAPSPLPRTRLCIVYNYELKHDDDSKFPEYYGEQSFKTLADGTIVARDNRQTKTERWGACIPTTLEGDRVDVTGRVIQKFSLGGNYPTVPCLGSIKRGLMGGDKNVLGHSCTRPVGADSVWTDWEGAKWYPTPDDVPDKSGQSVKQRAAASAAAASKVQEDARRAQLVAIATGQSPAPQRSGNTQTREPYVDQQAVYQREQQAKAIQAANRAEQALRDSGNWGKEEYNRMYKRPPSTPEGKALAAANIAAYGRAEGRNY